MKAQEPVHYIIGEEELAGVDVYCMLKSASNEIWMGTDKGLLKYDGYEFTQYTNNEIESLSLFGIAPDSKGSLYCHNLNGQVFQFKNDSLHLYYTIPDSLMRSNLEFVIDSSDALILAANKIIKIDSNQSVSTIKTPHSLSVPKIVYYQKKVFIFNNGKYIYQIEGDSANLYTKNLDKPGFSSFRQKDGILYLGKLIENNLYYLNDRKFEKYSFQTEVLAYRKTKRFFIDDFHNFWFPVTPNGGFVFNQKGQPLFNSNRIFKNYFLAHSISEPDGSMWISTLGKGLIYIPSAKGITYQNHPVFDKYAPRKVFFDVKGNLITLNEDNSIFTLNQSNGTVREICAFKQKINFFDYVKAQNSIYFQDNFNLYKIDLASNAIKKFESSLGAIKEIEFINDSLIVVANGINTKFWNPEKDEILASLPTGRTYHIFKTQTELLLGSVTGTFIYRNDKLTTLKYNGSEIKCSSIDGLEDTIYLATANQGIFKVIKNKIVEQLTTEQGLLSNNINKISYYKGLLFASHDFGIQWLDPSKKMWSSIDQTDGLSSKRVLDFKLYNNQIAIVTPRNLQVFNYTELNKDTTPPFLEFSELTIKDKASVFEPNAIYTHDQNQIEISFKAKSYRHRGQMTYAYRLIGIDTNWQTNGFKENRIKYQSLPHGKYKFEVQAFNENEIPSQKISWDFTIKPPFWKTWWFVISISALCILIILLIYRQQVKRAQQKTELVHSQLKAIKSQMNPHFIFNALNSIQDLILKEEIDKSYRYISKFADLVRRTLNYSEKDFISIEDEIRLLNVYLDLEKLRFKDNFDVRIDVNNVENIEIPPMMIQPFVENAIKHGLLHKEGEKALSIEFKIEDALICIIKDNGIGRVRANEIKNRQNKHHESFSIKAIKNRFQMFTELFNSDIGIEIDDLYDKEIPKGTKVTIRLPYRTIY